MLNSSLRILMLTPYHKTQRGNSVTSTRLQNGLRGQGFEVELLSMEDGSWLQHLRNAVANQDYALIHAFHARHCGEALAAVPELRKLPLLLTATGTDLHYDLPGAGAEAVLLAMWNAWKIVIFNEDFSRLITNYYPEAGSKLCTIPQGICLAEGVVKSRAEMGIAEKQFVFLLPSGLRPVKNIEMAINSLQRLRKIYPQTYLLIMGAVIDPLYSKQLGQRIKDLEWISCRGEIPHQDMKGYLLAGDIVLNTSRSEGQPQGALEAMSLGKPCILTAVPGNLNLISDGVEGFYVHNEDELLAAALKLIQQPLLCQEMGTAARQLVESKFTLEAEIMAYKQLYRKILSEQRK